MPFARGRGAVPDETGGLGLGRRSAEAHGGEAFAHNGTERGAVVGLTLAAE
jgi:hypothetical protein